MAQVIGSRTIAMDNTPDRLAAAGNRYRRIAGALMGAGLGLVYGLVSQTINLIVIPGIPFYQPPFGPEINVALCFLGGALLGLVSAWPQESATGVVVASLSSALVVGSFIMTTVTLDWKSGPGIVVVVIFFLLPVFGFLAPIVWSLRWAVDRQEDSYLSGYFTRSRVWAPLVLAIAVSGLGATVLYPPEARPVLARMNALMQAGQAAASAASLPQPLLSDEVGEFLEGAKGAYGLEWTRRELQRYGIPQSATNLYDQSIVVAHFENGWTLACLFITPNIEPMCRRQE